MSASESKKKLYNTSRWSEKREKKKESEEYEGKREKVRGGIIDITRF
jgi:hypothetical protein